MKNLSFVVLILLTACSTTKEILNENLKQYEETVNIPGKSKNDLYLQVNTWFVESFRSAESVIEFSDKEAGRIIGKYVFTYGKSLIRSVIQVDVKDEAYKISFKSPLIKNTGQDIDYRNVKTNASLEIINKEWKALSASFKEYISRTDNW